MVIRRSLAFALALTLTFAVARADVPWDFAVQISASVDASQNKVTLRWPAPTAVAADGYVPDYTVYRKAVADLGTEDWGSGTALSAGATSYSDTVQPGVAYEYKVERHYNHWGLEYFGYGYVRTGIQVPLVENRGTALVVVESGVAGDLGAELDQLTSDLRGDGWRVVRITDFSSSSNPADVRARIRQEYNRGGNVQAVFLIGHLPVVYSGTATNPDGHSIRPMPADGFYGDMTGDWGSPTNDGEHWVYPANTFPGRIVLQVGRVDFADLPAIYAVSPFSSELALLKNYFAKDHAFRQAQRVPPRRGLLGDAFGEYWWQGAEEPFSAEGYRNLAALFGDQITVADNYHGNVAGAGDWINQVTSSPFLWAFGCGPGGDSADSFGGLGTNGSPLTSVALVQGGAKADFYMLFGSFVVDWARPNNLLRAALATADYGLASTWAGRPFLNFQAMGLGETIGYCFRLSENQTGQLYQTPVTVRPSGNEYMQGVHLALMGDPTLRLHPVPPVGQLAAANGAVTWTAPAGVNIAEYRVYRLNTDTQQYELEAKVPPTTLAYSPQHGGTYMVRVVTLETGSGTYYNASQGVFWMSGGGSVQTTPTPQPQTSGAVKLAVPLLFTPSATLPGPYGPGR